jgi:Flp pilus assembly protein CpaB
VKLSQKRMGRPSLGGLLATRPGALGLALLCAICAAGVFVFAMGRYRQSVQTGNKQATVLIAAGEIQKGTSGAAIAAQRLYKSTPIIATQVVPGALSDASFLNGEVAQIDILPGQQLTAADFGTAGGLTGTLAPDQRAISLSIDEAHGDTDVLQAGDRVDVYGMFAGKAGTPELTLLVPNALVIKPAGATVPGTPAAALTGASLVLAVSTSQAPILAYATDNGKLWVVLRPVNADNPSAGVTTLSSVLTAGSAALSATQASTTNNTTKTHP